jgi:enterochelin esterase-like enzyme
MRHATFVATSIFATALLLPAQRGDRGPRRDSGPTLQNFTVETGTISSTKVRDGEAGYEIYLPKGHGDEANKDKTYPWIVWLSGFGGNGEFTNRGGASVLDKLRGEGKLPELALVVYRAPSGQGGRRGRSLYMNGEAACDTEDLLCGDFLEQLQKKYRLGSDRKQRAMMGVSAGGFGALKIAMRHPDVFGAVAVHSAAILPADPKQLGGNAEGQVQRALRTGIAEEIGNPIDPLKWRAHMPLGLAADKKPEELQGLQIYFDAGTADGYGFCPPNEELAKVMAEKGHKHLFRKVAGGGHAWSSESMTENLAVSLQFVAAAFAGKDAAAEMAPKPTAEPGKAEAKPDAGK